MKVLRLFVSIFFVFFSLSSEATDISLEKDLQTDLEKSRSIVKKAKEKLNTSESVTEEITQLKTLTEEIRSTYTLLQERFALREETTASINTKALERHRAMSEGYRKSLEEYLSLIDSLPSESSQQTPPFTSPLDKGGMRGVIEQLQTLLDSILHKKKKPIIGNLPYKNLNYPAQEPDTTTSIKPAYKGGNKTVSTEDTKDTEEAPISNEIATLAQSLNWNPVSIYEYVKNNIETEWYWGCMKGAEETYRQKSGNDCDQATLLTALLRASGFPTRYIKGTMEYFKTKGEPIEKAKNLLGIEDPWKIAEYLQKAGIPYKTNISGGKITNFQLEHIWVETRIPYGNYRGAIIDESDKHWFGLDTSIKQKGYTYNTPIDIFEQSAISSQLSAIRDQYLGLSTNTQSVDPQTVTPLEYLQSYINTQLTNTQPGTTYNDLLRTKTLKSETLKIVPASMQITQKNITNEYTEIPEELKHKVKFIATDTNNNELFNYELQTMNLSNQRVAITYEPETVEDQQIIDSYGGLDNTPAYLISLRPVLTVNGERKIIAQNGLPMGSAYELTIQLISPNATESITNTHIAGNLSVIGIVAQKAVDSSQNTVDGDKDAEQLLYEEANNYINRWNSAEEELASLFHLVITRPIPTVITIGGVLDVTYLLDTPHDIEWKGDYLDADIRAIEVTPSASPLTQEGETDRKKLFMQLSALQGSVLEYRIFEDDWQVPSVSTANLFQTVNSRQDTVDRVEILTIDKTNIASILPTLTFDDNILEDIQNSVNQNLIVKIPQTEIQYEDWTGIGYIKENTETKEAGYILSGMIAGGMTAISPDKWKSSNLSNIMDNPYSDITNTLTALTINITFPFNGTTLAESTVDVEGTVSDPIASIKVNGIEAEISSDGKFIAYGIQFIEGTNEITAKATTPYGASASYTITITYQPAQTQPNPVSISITTPADGATINKPLITVSGTVTTEAKEVWIKVNGILADIYNNQFVANKIPLTEGDNSIIANAIDSNGATGRAEVTIKAVTTEPYITLNSNITSGIPALTTYFSITEEIPDTITNYQIDFEGDGVIDYQGTTFDNITHTYTQEGIFFPTATVTDDKGNTYSDTIGITVLNKTEIDALLKGKWEEMKEKLKNKDVEGAITYFDSASQEKYRSVFTSLLNSLPDITANMQTIEIISIENGVAEYRIKRMEDVGELTYYIYFAKDANGLWKIDKF